jgi:hypothetical protein
MKKMVAQQISSHRAMDLSSLVGVIIQGGNSANGRGILTDTLGWENFTSFTVVDINFYGHRSAATEDLFRDHRNGHDQKLYQHA